MEQEKKQHTFMLKIWGITFLSMCITGLVTYGYHFMVMKQEAKLNASETEAIVFRMGKYEAYKKSLETIGKEKALEMIIEE